jgi:predicted exporter
VADGLVARMEASPFFRRIAYRFDLNDLPEMLDVLRGHRTGLMTDEDLARVRERLTPGALEAILASWRRQLIETPAPLLAMSLQRDPLGMDELLAQKVQSLQAIGGPVQPVAGRLFSRDRRHLLIMAQPVHAATDSLHAQALVGFLDAACREAGQSAGGRVRISTLSPHRMSLENATRIKRDIGLTLTLSILAIGLVALAVFRRPYWIVLVMLPTGFGALFALAVLRLTTPGISAIAIGCGSMLLGIAVDLGIHILYHADQVESEAGHATSDDKPALFDAALIRLIDRLFRPILLC